MTNIQKIYLRLPGLLHERFLVVPVTLLISVVLPIVSFDLRAAGNGVVENADPNIYRSIFVTVVTSVFYVLPLMIFYVVKKNSLISMIVAVQLYFIIIPMALYSSLIESYLGLLYFMTCLAVFAMCDRIDIRLTVQKIFLTKYSYEYIYIVRILSLVVLVFSILYLLISYDINVNFLWEYRDVYRFRAENPQALPRLYLLVSGVVIPLVVYLSILGGRHWVIIAVILYGLTLFLVSGHKFMLAFSVLVIGFGYLWRFGRVLPMFILGGVLIVTVIGLNLLDNNLIGSILLRRSFEVQGHLGIEYFNFFIDQPKGYWATLPFVREFVTYPYDEPLVRVFSDSLGIEGWANTGFLPFLFANFGFGSLVIVALTGVGFKLFDLLYDNVRLSAFLGLIAGISLVNGGLIGLLVVNFFLITLFAFMPLAGDEPEEPSLSR